MSTAGLSTRKTEPRPAGWKAAWLHFWFAPSDPIGLHVLRVLTAGLILAWLLPLAGHVDEFLGLGGWIDAQAYQELSPQPDDPGMVDPRGWSLVFLFGEQAMLLHACYWGVIGAAALFLLGFFVRPLSVVMWLAAASFSANPVIEIDTDVYLRIATFYLMVGYVFLGWQVPRVGWLRRLLTPWDYSLLQRPSPESAGSPAATVAVRLWQIHFALLIVVSGLHKLQLPEWWTGLALWYVLNPPGRVTVESLAAWGGPRFTLNISFISLAVYAVLAWQILFPAFAWRRGWGRWLLLGGAGVGGFGLMLLYPIPLLGPAFFVACLGFVVHDQGPRWRELLVGLWSLLGRSPQTMKAIGGSPTPAVTSAGRR